MMTIPGWPDYRKASYSSAETNCVAVNRTRTSVRDTKNMSGGVLKVANLPDAFTAIKAGRFDLS